MAITFNPSTKIIQLDSNTTSEKELWTAFVDWSVQSDNLKYWVWMTQIGWVVPIALYIYLELWWKIRPVEADWVTTISWNLLVQWWWSPIAPTIWNYNVLVNMETPVKAATINTWSWSCDLTLVNNKLDILERLTRASVKIEWTVLIMYDDIWELQRWNLLDINNTPSNTNVYNRIKV